MFNNPHDRCDTVSNIFRQYLRDLLWKFLEIYQKYSNSVNCGSQKIPVEKNLGPKNCKLSIKVAAEKKLCSVSLGFILAALQSWKSPIFK